MRIWSALTGYRVRHFLLEMVIAISLAFLVWLYMYSRGHDTIDMVDLPVRIVLAPGIAGNYELEIPGSSRVPVSFSGPPSRLREVRELLQHGALQATVSVSVPNERQKDAVYRETVEVQSAEIPVPPGVYAVVTEGRNQISVVLHRLSERHLPVRLEYAGDAHISQVKLEPTSVLVRGPKAVLDRARVVTTVPYAPPQTSEGNPSPNAVMRMQVPLIAELEGRAVHLSHSTVTVRCRLHAKQKVYDLPDVPVQFLCPPGYPWRPHFSAEQPSRVKLRLLGPAGDEPPVVHAYVDLTQTGFSRGRNVAPLHVQLPRDFQLVQDAPRRVTFQLDPVERSAD